MIKWCELWTLWSYSSHLQMLNNILLFRPVSFIYLFFFPWILLAELLPTCCSFPLVSRSNFWLSQRFSAATLCCKTFFNRMQWPLSLLCSMSTPLLPQQRLVHGGSTRTDVHVSEHWAPYGTGIHTQSCVNTPKSITIEKKLKSSIVPFLLNQSLLSFYET